MGICIAPTIVGGQAQRATAGAFQCNWCTVTLNKPFKIACCVPPRPCSKQYFSLVQWVDQQAEPKTIVLTDLSTSGLHHGWCPHNHLHRVAWSVAPGWPLSVRVLPIKPNQCFFVILPSSAASCSADYPCPSCRSIFAANESAAATRTKPPTTQKLPSK